MTKRTWSRLLLPLAAASLVLSACGSSDAEPMEEGAASSAMASEMASEMASDMPSEMASEDATSSAESMPAAPEATTAAAGGYITLTEYSGAEDMYSNGDVVLFFAADWCPTCQEATENLEADPSAIPVGLTIVRVDYDDSDDLKQKYGVTTQHTFVQVDAEGNELAKWTGSVTADEIAEQTT